MASKNTNELLKSLEHNIQLLLKMATSVGLKLNDSKTKLMFAHLTDDEKRRACAGGSTRKARAIIARH